MSNYEMDKTRRHDHSEWNESLLLKNKKVLSTVLSKYTHCSFAISMSLVPERSLIKLMETVGIPSPRCPSNTVTPLKQ